MITYEQLKNGYVLQGEDKLVLHGLEYKVVSSTITSYLYYIGGTNSRVFDVLGMGAEERKNFIKGFNPVNYADAQGAFPEFNDFKTLTDLVIALYEVPEYKVGDWVTVLPRTGTYYPIIYADKMVEYAGNTYQVKYCNLHSSAPTHDGIDSGDPHSYNLSEIVFYWTTHMLRRATDEEIRKAKGEIKDCNYPKSPEPMASGYLKPLSEEPTDTEIRLPNNEEDTPHIKL